MKTLKELATEVYNARSLPGVLADLHIELASMYSNLNDEWVEIQLKKADFWQVKDAIEEEDTMGVPGKTNWKPREKQLSDKAVEMLWIKEGGGRRELRVKYALKSLEKLMSAVKSSLVNATIEARNI